MADVSQRLFRQRLGTVTDIPVVVLLAIVPAGLVAAHIGWPTVWSALSLSVSVAVFGLIWGIWMQRRSGRLQISILGFGLWVCGIHLSMWIPLVLHSYLSGQGLHRLDYSVLSSLVTATIIAWYILNEYLWQTITLGLGLCASVMLLRSGASTDVANNQDRPKC